MEKSSTQKPIPHKKVKTRGNVVIPGGFRDGLMGRSKETKEIPRK